MYKNIKSLDCVNKQCHVVGQKKDVMYKPGV